MFVKILVCGLLITFCAALNLFAESPIPPAENGQQRRIIKHEFTETNAKAKWTIKIEYPELRLEGNLPARGFNLAAKNMAMKQAEGFREQASEFKNFFLKVLYEIELDKNGVVSVNFGSAEFTGGMHPDYWTFTLNYDLENDRELKLTDLFNQDSAYLSVISKNSIEQLKKELKDSADEDRIQSGAGEDLKNFEKWNITKKGLKFTFDPNDVAGFIPGSFETLVPYESFSTEMRSLMFNQVTDFSNIAGNQDDCGIDAYVIDKDPKGLNVRDQPGVKGKVLATLKTNPNSTDSGFIMVRVTGYSNGWVKIVKADGDDGSLFEGIGWVSAKMVATGTMGPSGEYNKPANLYASSNSKRKIGTIPSESEVLIAGFTCGWVKVKYKTKIGWIRTSNICGSPVTSCS